MPLANRELNDDMKVTDLTLEEYLEIDHRMQKQRFWV